MGAAGGRFVSSRNGAFQEGSSCNVKEHTGGRGESRFVCFGPSKTRNCIVFIRFQPMLMQVCGIALGSSKTVNSRIDCFTRFHLYLS